MDSFTGNVDQTAEQALLKELKAVKIEIVESNDSWKRFTLNGSDSVKFETGANASNTLEVFLRNEVDHTLIERNGVYSIATLARHAVELESWTSKHRQFKNDKDFARLVEIVVEAAKEAEAHIRERLDAGKAEFYDLPTYYAEGMKVFFGEGDEVFGGTVTGTEVCRSWGGWYLKIAVEVVANIKGKPVKGTRDAIIPMFGGIVQIDALSVRELKIGSAEYEALTERGRVFATTVNGPTYLAYEGQIERPSYWSSMTMRAEGRVIVDPATFARLDSDQFRNCTRSIFGGNGFDEDDDNGTAIEGVSEELLFACVPYVFGFSFRAKAWGTMKVAQLKTIQWADGAFDKLVLEENTKRRVKALVRNSGGSFSDIIGGKGGGCIFMLHGEPGQGKTLTAETVAEELQRPLYSISVGELGTNPDQLEKRLREILDVATVWNAVLLLDEADIFLEARDEKDILRNAMVGVFLRLLEYHQGVLFLTTNRVRNIDPAFFSRISVGIRFGKGDEEKRQKVWWNLLSAAGIALDNREVFELAMIDVNGRQVKNAIRLAQTMAQEEGASVTYERIRNEVDETLRFEAQMRNAPAFTK